MRDKTILITGAASGYGQALADACGASGATVILLDKSVKKLEQQYDRMIAAGCPQPAILPVNLAGADANAFDTVLEAIKSQFSQLDGLVLNAVEFGGLTPIRNFNPERWYLYLQANLNANFHLLQLLLPLMEKSQDGRVIYVHDAVADRAEANWGAYSVAKSGMRTLITMLDQEHVNNDKLHFYTATPAPMATGVRQKITPAGSVDGSAASDQVDHVLAYLRGWIT